MHDRFHGILIAKHHNGEKNDPVNEKVVSAKLALCLPKSMGRKRKNGTKSGSLYAMIQSFKSTVSRRAHRDPGFNSSVWQRGYYDRIIRNEKELKLMYIYIENNPYRID